MFLSRNKLYLFLSILCTSGYFWMYFNLTKNPIINTEVCLFKHVTKIPCPSCGSSRSITQIIKGNIQQALYLNPLGFISAFILLITPIWILIDVILQKKSLFNWYKKLEQFIRKPKIAILLALLIIINWIWNIKKGI
ncbi:MAG: hypothetical protein RLZZ414_1577 [Bacteroidota bacterium]